MAAALGQYKLGLWGRFCSWIISVNSQKLQAYLLERFYCTLALVSSERSSFLQLAKFNYGISRKESSYLFAVIQSAPWTSNTFSWQHELSKHLGSDWQHSEEWTGPTFQAFETVWNSNPSAQPAFCAVCVVCMLGNLWAQWKRLQWLYPSAG